MAEARTPHVCFVLPKLHPTENGTLIGGAASYATSLAAALQEIGVGPCIVGGASESAIARLTAHPLRDLIYPCVQPESHVGVVRGVTALHQFASHINALQRERPFDIIHSHSGFFPYAAIASYFAKRAETITIHSLYCPISEPVRGRKTWWNKPGFARLAFRRVKRVVATSDNVARSIERSGVPARKIVRIPPGIQIARFSDTANRTLPATIPEQLKGRKRLLFVGNCSWDKGLDLLLRALRILLDRKTPAALMFTSENVNRSSEVAARIPLVRAIIADLQLGSSVLELETVADMRDAYAAADLLVAPFRTTHGPSDYPVPVLEAMASGLPVVATRVGGIPELIQDGQTGFLVDECVPQALAAKIESVLSAASLMQQVGEAAARSVSARFSAERSASRVLALYQQLLNGKER